jgi:hypothetical protein
MKAGIVLLEIALAAVFAGIPQSGARVAEHSLGFSRAAGVLERAEQEEEAQQSADSATYTLKGTVINSVTGEGIHGALVQIYGQRQRSMLTGPDGSFQFDGVAAGQYAVLCRKPGYFSQEELEPGAFQRPIAQAGPDAGSVRLKLIPEGIIYGRISGNNGEPLENLPVHLLSKEITNGEMEWRESNQTRTDEEGEFRIAELQPGTYYVFIGPGQDSEVLPGNRGESLAKGYAGVFYPGASDLSSAAPIQITPGKHFEVMSTISLSPFFRISGTVGGYPQGQPVNIQVLNAAGEEMSTSMRLNQRTGQFQTGWLPAGAYVVKGFATDQSSQQTFTDSGPVNLNANVSGVQLSLVPGINIPISVRVERTKAEGESEDDGPDGLGRNQGFLAANVMLNEKNGMLSRKQYGMENVGRASNSSLAIRNVPPGVYEIAITPNGPYYVDSARSGAVDLLSQDITISPGASLEPFEIVMRDDTAELHGTVAYGENARQATIVAIPERIRQGVRNVGTTHPRGEFEFPQLAPGTYTVLAVDNLQRLEYRNPEVMQKYLSKAREVTLEPNQSVGVELELIHVQE